MNVKKFRYDQPASGRDQPVARLRELGDELEFIAYTYAPGASFQRHRHASEQLTVVLEGELVFQFDDGEVALSAGEALLIPGNAAHGARVPGNAVTTRTLNVFTPVRDRPPDAT